MISVVRRPAWTLLALSLVLAACGGESGNRLDLETPGADTGRGTLTFPLTNPTPEATPAPSPTPKPEGGPVTREEKRIIRGWADQLRAGHVEAAARYFMVPSVVSNAGVLGTLSTPEDVHKFNEMLPCGAKLVKTRRSTKHFVIGTFKLTKRPGADCGTGTGELAEVAFLIQRHRITQWMRAPDPQPEPTPTPPIPDADTT